MTSSIDSAQLEPLADALRRLHKALIDVEADNFGPVSGPFQLLNLVANHPHFAWLHHLSELMVELDEMTAGNEPIDIAQAAALRVAIERLVGPRAPAAPAFRERFATLVQQSPVAAMEYGDLRRALSKLPNTRRDLP